MPRGGQNAKPNELHKRDGTYVPSRHANRLDAPKLDGIPEPPADFSDRHREVWFDLCDKLKELGTLARADYDAVKMYVAAAVDEERAREILERDGLVIYVGEAPRQNPAWKIVQDAAKLRKSLFDQFGLTPLARTRVKVEQPPKPSKILEAMAGKKITWP